MIYFINPENFLGYNFSFKRKIVIQKKYNLEIESLKLFSLERNLFFFYLKN